MREAQKKIRLLIVAIAIVVVVLFFSDTPEYTVPLVGVAMSGKALWPLLGVAQLVLVTIAYLTRAISHVMPPWRIPRKGPWGEKSVWQLPEYWHVFFLEFVPAVSIPISLILIAYRVGQQF